MQEKRKTLEMLVKKARHKSCKIVQIVCLKVNLREKKGTQSEFNKIDDPVLIFDCEESNES